MDISIETPKSIFQILKEGFVLYLSHFKDYTKVMIYPIVAHLIGIPYIIIVSYTIPDRFPPSAYVENSTLIFAVTLILTVPGFILFLNGFWKYLVAMVSLNRYTAAIINKDTIITTKTCGEYVRNRKNTYVYILCLMMLLWISGFVITIFPTFLSFILPGWLIMISIAFLGFVSLLMVICLSIYFSLCFQVFAFEDIKVLEVFKRSFNLIENNFWRTFLLMVILYLITGVIFPFITHILLELVGIVNLLMKPVNWFSVSFINNIKTLPALYHSIPSETIDSVLSFYKDPATELSKNIVISTIDGIITAAMLPLGTACFTLLYFDILSKKKGQGNIANV